MARRIGGISSKPNGSRKILPADDAMGGATFGGVDLGGGTGRGGGAWRKPWFRFFLCLRDVMVVIYQIEMVGWKRPG